MKNKTDVENDTNSNIANNEINNNDENITNNIDNENNTNNALPQTGETSSIIYSILGLIISFAGLKLFRCKYE